MKGEGGNYLGKLKKEKYKIESRIEKCGWHMPATFHTNLNCNVPYNLIV